MDGLHILSQTACNFAEISRSSETSPSAPVTLRQWANFGDGHAGCGGWNGNSRERRGLCPVATDTEITVYERELRPGGHSHTVEIDYDGRNIAVDTGFIVYNELNYPGLTALFAHLGVETQPSQDELFGFGRWRQARMDGRRRRGWRKP